MLLIKVLKITIYPFGPHIHLICNSYLTFPRAHFYTMDAFLCSASTVCLVVINQVFVHIVQNSNYSIKRSLIFLFVRMPSNCYDPLKLNVTVNFCDKLTPAT